jgi:hypothetical protein
LPVKRHAFGDATDGGLKALKLEAFEAGAAGGFDGLIPKHGGLAGAADAAEEPAAPAVTGSFRRSKT